VCVCVCVCVCNKREKERKLITSVCMEEVIGATREIVTRNLWRNVRSWVQQIGVWETFHDNLLFVFPQNEVESASVGKWKNETWRYNPCVLNFPWFSDGTHFRLDIYTATREPHRKSKEFHSKHFQDIRIIWYIVVLRSMLQTAVYKFPKCVEWPVKF
jgi:hypothetical protein